MAKKYAVRVAMRYIVEEVEEYTDDYGREVTAKSKLGEFASEEEATLLKTQKEAELAIVQPA